MIALGGAADAAPCAADSPACHLEAGKVLLASDPKRASEELLASFRLDERTDTLTLYAQALTLDRRYALALETWRRIIIFRDSELDAANEAARSTRGRKRTVARAAAAKAQRQSEQAAAAIIGLWPNVARVRVRYAVGLVVTRDGVEVDPAQDVLVNAVSDELVFTRKDGQAARLRVELAAGSNKTVDAPTTFSPAAVARIEARAERGGEPANERAADRTNDRDIAGANERGGAGANERGGAGANERGGAGANARGLDRPNARADARGLDRPNARGDERSLDRPNARADERSLDRPNARADERSLERPNARANERPNARGIDRTNARTNARTNEHAVEARVSPTERAGERVAPPAARPFDIPPPRVVAESQPARTVPARSAPSSASASASASRRLALGLAASAVVLEGIAGGFWYAASRDLDRARDAGCSDAGRCPFGRAAELAERSNDRARIAQWTAIGGGALAAAGVTLYLLDRRATRERLTLHVGPSSTAIAGSF